MSTRTSFQTTVSSTDPTFVAGPQTPIPVDLRRFHFGASIICSFAAGTTASYWVELTGDPADDAFVYWNTHDILGSGTYPPTAVTTPANSNLAFPCTGVRLNIASLTGTMTMALILAIGTS